MIDSVRIFDFLPLRLVREPLLLDSGDIENVCLGQHFFQGLELSHTDTSLARCRDDVGRHRERWRSDKVEVNGVVAQEGHQTVHRASIFQVTEQSDCASIDCSELRPDCVDVQ